MFIQLTPVVVTKLQRIADPRNGAMSTVPISQVALFALDSEGGVYEFRGDAMGWVLLNMTLQEAPASD